MAGLKARLRRIAAEVAELPVLRSVAEPLHRRLFRRPYQHGNAYCGIHASYADAKAHAPASLPSTYDIAAAGKLYRSRLDHVVASDYPLIYWLSRLFAQGATTVFDLGGHIGVSYYAFAKYLDYPAALRWRVHDVPAVMAAGREWATQEDRRGALEFCATREGADGCDVLMANGSLQYLEYTLAELLATLAKPPANLLVSLTPMHPRQGYFTLQNIGIAICPYRVASVPEFTAALEALGYTLVDHWQSPERQVRVPFHGELSVDCYHGFHFRRG